MAKVNSNIRPRVGTAADLAGQHIHKHGPATASELFIVANFGPKPSEKALGLRRATATGWLVELEDGKFGIGAIARKHYDEMDAAEKGSGPVGQIAAARTPTDVFARPALSKKYIPNPRGSRLDIPDWSIRAGGTNFHKA